MQQVVLSSTYVAHLVQVCPDCVWVGMREKLQERKRIPKEGPEAEEGVSKQISRGGCFKRTRNQASGVEPAEVL